MAVLRRGHRFESLEAVKEELTHSAKMLIPYGLTGQVRNFAIINNNTRPNMEKYVDIFWHGPAGFKPATLQNRGNVLQVFK